MNVPTVSACKTIEQLQAISQGQFCLLQELGCFPSEGVQASDALIAIPRLHSSNRGLRHKIWSRDVSCSTISTQSYRDKDRWLDIFTLM